MALDVNNNKETHTGLSDIESLMTVLQFSPVPSFIIDPREDKFTIAAVNHSFLQLAGSTADDFVGMKIAELFKPLDYSAFQNKYSIVRALQQVMFSTMPESITIFGCTIFSGSAAEKPADYFDCDIYPVLRGDQKVQLIVLHLREAKTRPAENHPDQSPENQAVAAFQVSAEADDMRHPFLKSVLDKEKEKYEDLFNLSPLPQFLYDMDTLRFLDVNEAAVAEYGYTRAEFLDLTLMDIRPGEDQGLLTDIMSSRVIKGSLGNSTVRHMKKNGDIIYVNVQGNSVRYGVKNARLVVVVNLTEKILARKALERSEQRFRALVQEGSDMIAIMNPEGTFHYVNPNTKAIIGIESDFYIGRNIYEFVYQDDVGLVAEHISLLMSHKRIQLPPYRFNLNNGEIRWIETIMTNMIDEPSVSGIILNSRDVTERINNDLRVQESIERFNVVSKATSDAVWDWDMKDDKLIWNKGLRGIFGYKVSETDDAWWLERIHKDDVKYVMDRFHSTIKNKRSRLEIEYRFRCSDGSYKNVLDRMFTTYNKAGEPIRMIGSIQDITERTKITREIKEQNDRLKEISWLQSHGVRAPLARVIGLTNLLSSGIIDEGSSEESLRYLVQSATELDNVIRDIIKKTEGLQHKL